VNRELAISLALVSSAVILTMAGLWAINPEKTLFPTFFVGACLLGAMVMQPVRSLLGVFRDAHWSWLAGGVLVVLASAWHVVSVVEDAYMIPMNAAFFILFLAICNLIGRRVRKDSRSRN
jgi:hypothetical protein